MGAQFGRRIERREILCNHISVMDRQASLNRVRSRKEPWDVIVIGGGATGVGCALDAASRGLDVLLLEQNDFGKGTSSRSTKLIHGGVRYLEQGNFSLVREALRERGLLLKNAPHVVDRLSFIVPCYSMREKIYYGFGLKIYDTLAGKYRLGRSRILSRRETTGHLPGVRTKGLRGGILYFDAQFDDARLLIDMALTASDHGACLLNYAKVTATRKDPSGRIAGVGFADLENSETMSVDAKVVINAAGPFCDEIRKLAEPNVESILKLSQGTHLVFRRKDDAVSAMLVPKTSDGRVLFAIPWHDHLLVGTTETPIDAATLEPRPLDTEIDFILETVQRYMASPPSRNDILSSFTGIRPLVRSSGKQSTAELSRGHMLKIDPSGLITITGGKWTTYRQMAEDAVNEAVAAAGLSVTRCQTRDLPIQDSGKKYSFSALIKSNSELSEKLHADLPYTKADVVRAVKNEMAVTVEDVLARRTRALFLNARAAVQIAPAVAEIMANEFGKEGTWIAKQVATFAATAKNYLPQ